MKKIYSILTVLLTVSLVSCSDFLKEENLSGITAENYYVDAAGYESLVNSCYASLRDIYESDPKMFEWGTDITTRGEIEPVSGTVGDRVIRATQLNEYNTLSSDNSGSDEFFTMIYAGIQRCNTAINKGNTIPGLSESQKNKRIGEVRTIRAFYYYLLVENYGGIPIVQEEINTAITHFVPNTETEVYEFILADLNAAVASVDVTTTDFGRVTQGVVKHLLSLIYLTKGYKTFGTSTDFTKSAQYAEEVISGANYTLLPAFTDVFRADNQKNKEIIFSVQYDATSLRNKTIGNGQNNFLGWRIFREPGFYDGETTLYNRRTSDFMPTQFLYTLYDTRKDARYDGTFLSQFYAVQDAKLGTATVKKGDLRFYFPKPDQAFTAQDSIALKTANPNVEIIRFNRWKQDFNGIGGALKFPMVNKFFDPAAQPPGNNEHDYRNTRDIILFRLAETYLLAAEAYFKGGQVDKAAEKLNVVRKRATLPGQSLVVTANDVTLDFILDERARELEGEYKRWLDLKRAHKLNRAFEQNILTKMANPAGVMDKYYLRPIPQTVRDRDTGGYPQNPGY
ncbi:RagB/SusD family nutrient uptake outer membrane protein [Spirosoma endbachense]|uniref:RagB/SusD family nutrient uptake outer membrane protein n=1 Tax=Spirosoma endbachense TaxID=2666025 RepID=A0A6P1VRG1_9BACT|nr:RagB/SusD family nutrient uptake outer membrane protein [Spirosoma endbachense]QHV94307.1 RagB/SusD family nutrient uptake outer membrane protein [Spirosoma endbachense]